MLEINDSQILMYLDGRADPEVRQVIENKREYQIRAQELEKTQKLLSKHLYRVACPDSLTLGEYQLGLLSHEERQALEQHVEDCPHCASELLEMVTFNQLSFVERLIAKLTSGGENRGQPGWVPSYGVRGGSASPLLYEAGEVQIAVDVQDDGEHPGYQSIIGFINGAEADDFEVSLWRENIQLMITQVDDLNYFALDNLSRGDYELLIRGPRVEIQIQKLTL